MVRLIAPRSYRHRAARRRPTTLTAGLLAVALSSACAGPQAHRVRRKSELAIGGSLIGVIASSLAIGAFPGEKPVFIGVTIGLGALAVASTVVYGVALSNEPPPTPLPAPPPPPDHRAEAWTLTQQAQTAARTGDCTTVAALDHQVAVLDKSFHDVVFARDAAIARCKTDRLNDMWLR